MLLRHKMPNNLTLEDPKNKTVVLTLVVNNVEFKDGVQVIDQLDRKAA